MVVTMLLTTTMMVVVNTMMLMTTMVMVMMMTTTMMMMMIVLCCLTLKLEYKVFNSNWIVLKCGHTKYLRLEVNAFNDIDQCVHTV